MSPQEAQQALALLRESDTSHRQQAKEDRLEGREAFTEQFKTAQMAAQQEQQARLMQMREQEMRLREQQFSSIDAKRQADLAEANVKLQRHTMVDEQRAKVYGDPEFVKFNPRSKDAMDKLNQWQAVAPDAFAYDPGLRQFVTHNIGVYNDWQKEQFKTEQTQAKAEIETKTLTEKGLATWSKYKGDYEGALAKAKQIGGDGSDDPDVVKAKTKLDTYAEALRSLGGTIPEDQPTQSVTASAGEPPVQTSTKKTLVFNPATGKLE